MLRRAVALTSALLLPAFVTVPASADGGSVSSECRFGGVLDPTNHNNVWYTGTAVVTPGVGDVVLATSLTCSVSNIPAGGNDFASQTVSAPGPATAVADVAVQFSGTLPITICKTVSVTFGPSPVVTVTSGPFCS